MGSIWKKLGRCNFVSGAPGLSDATHGRSCFCNLLPAVALLSSAFFIGSVFFASDYQERMSRWKIVDYNQISQKNGCKNQCRHYETELLPKGIMSGTSDFEMRPLWGPPNKQSSRNSKSLLAIAVGVKQKENVNQIVKKFCSDGFAVMLFHYDGVVDQWRDLQWFHEAIHVSAINQTKWWFAKRFLHPDVVARYKYIFLWDEDLGVEHFHPGRYLSIVRDEGLEISQPALDRDKSEVHHQITARGRRSRVHRRIYKYNGSGRCYENSTAPPCTGWVEMMAPVFSRAAWRCVWYMIQNDLIYAWGLDMKLGYCAQGDRTKNVGVVDSEYIVHQGIPTLGAIDENKSHAEAPTQASWSKGLDMKTLDTKESSTVIDRFAVRRQSSEELVIFRERWEEAVKGDECWMDPYPQPKMKVSP